MAAKRDFPKAKSNNVFGQARKPAKMFRAGLYARVSTNDQQTLPMQSRAMREYPARRGFRREDPRERTRAGLAHARQNDKQLGRPMTAGLQVAEIRKLHRAGVAKAEIARRLQIGRTSVRRILAATKAAPTAKG